MKSLRMIVLTIGLVLLFCGCSSEKEKELNVVFSEINALEISTMSIRTQMSADYPEEKVLTDIIDIEKVIEFLSNIDGKRVVEDEDHDGWQFWILFEGYNINITGDRIEINNEKYRIDKSISDDFFEIYKETKAEGRKYP